MSVTMRCPVTGEVSAWPDHLALPLHSLSEEFAIPMEHIFAMAKITKELGEDWLADSVEFYERWQQTLNDNHVLKNGADLSIHDLLAIRDRAREGLQLLLKHERDRKSVV